MDGYLGREGGALWPLAQGTVEAGARFPQAELHLHGEGLLAAIPRPDVPFEVERLTAHPTLASQAHARCCLRGSNLGRQGHPEICVTGLIADPECSLPRKRGQQLRDGTSRGGEVNTAIDTAGGFVFHTKNRQNLRHVDMGNIGLDGTVQRRLATAFDLDLCAHGAACHCKDRPEREMTVLQRQVRGHIMQCLVGNNHRVALKVQPGIHRSGEFQLQDRIWRDVRTLHSSSP